MIEHYKYIHVVTSTCPHTSAVDMLNNGASYISEGSVSHINLFGQLEKWAKHVDMLDFTFFIYSRIAGTHCVGWAIL